MFSGGASMPSPSSIFSAYASMTASIMLVRSLANELVPQPIRGYLLNYFRYFFKPRSQTLTLVIEEFVGIARNLVYDAAETYLCTKISPDTVRLKISKTPKDKSFTIRLEKGEKLVDWYNEVELNWRFVCAESEQRSGGSPPNDHSPPRPEKRCFELSFHKKHKDLVLNYYMPFILQRAKAMKDEERVLKMHTLSSSYSYGGGKWDSINLEHPSTFQTLAMEPEQKDAILEDLNRFLKRKEFYKRVGRAWKRGYLLYGPPGTGKSSLIAAMANYLKFDIYDLQLANVVRDSDLRKLLLSTANKSILVIEDIDCTIDIPDRRVEEGSRKPGDTQLTLSGLLNFIDGLWSSCGDERIIIFTTNHRERLDPALLRPGRMDMHIHMSYCSYEGFKLLASNYLGISNHDHEHDSLLGEIKGLIEETQITPAEVAEELMKCEDSHAALHEIAKLLKRKKLEGDVCQEEVAEKDAVVGRGSKRRKVCNKQTRSARINRRSCKVKRI